MHASSDVDSLMGFMLTRYGAAWDAKYAMNDPALVREDWARMLHGVANFRIRFALENLPADFPPNVLQFRKLCDAAPPPPDLVKIPHRGQMNHDGLRRLAAMLGRIVFLQKERNPRQWIADLKAIPEKELSPAQLAALRAVEANPPPDEGVDALALERKKAETGRRLPAAARPVKKEC
jgi:hypothetical protein